MDLKSLISKPAEKKENYWSLLIEPKWVRAAVWEIDKETVKVIAKGVSSAWENPEELVAACDTALSSCAQSIPEDFPEPTKTVFGVISSWVEDGNIKDEYLEGIKEVCQKLSLEPTGFVVVSEAIAHFMKIEEGSPLNSIIVGIADENLEISLYKLGKLSGSTYVARSVSIVDDLVEGLVRFGTNETYPSRIILYDGREADLEEIKTELTNIDWGSVEKVRFLHTPKVEAISPDNKIVAVSLAGASEMGGATGVSQDAAEHENVTAPKEPFTAEDLGFVIDEPTPKVVSVDNNQPSEPMPVKKPGLKMPSLPSMPRIGVPKFPMHLPKSGNNLGRPLVIGGSALMAFIIAGFLFWWFYPKADVTVYVSPKKLDQTISLALGTDLKTRSEDVEVSGQKTKSTTGTKTVGDKAKGSVRIQNGTAFPINLPAGTVLISASDLRFTTNQSASVSGALTPTSPGTATVEVTANDIGSDYNLAKDEVLKVGNYPKAEVDATSTIDFSGGSSRQISAVAKEDLDSLSKDLTSELTSEAKKKLTENKSADEYFLESLITLTATTEEYSNKVGDEASTVKLTLGLKAKGLMVTKNDLTSIVSKALEGKVPSGFVVRDDQITYQFIANKSDSEEVDAEIAVNLLPMINPDDVAKTIAGKYPQQAEDYLKSVPGFSQAEFAITPLFPGKLGTLPHLSKRISVVISAVR